MLSVIRRDISEIVSACQALDVQGGVVGTIGVEFEEPSTRTRLSTLAACAELGLHAVEIVERSRLSISKGENLADSYQVMGEIFDLFACRTTAVGMPHRISRWTSKPVLNLGDGPGEHPSQAVSAAVAALDHGLDFRDLTLGVWGDIVKARTIFSTVMTFLLLGARVRLVSMVEGEIPDRLLTAATQLGLDQRLVHLPHKSDLVGVDVMYITRLQQERRAQFTAPSHLTLDLEDIEGVRLVLHPLPRGAEVTEKLWAALRPGLLAHVRRTKRVRKRLLQGLAHGHWTAWGEGVSWTHASHPPGQCSFTSAEEIPFFAQSESKHCAACWSRLW
ncbi:hypothetical protein [Lentzea sp. NPDC092896]|uniref:hypothetical protein n=1 Tax=Lentzea sp. NPDC092896 TaxID=3364127 RepID=UPI00382052FB